MALGFSIIFFNFWNDDANGYTEEIRGDEPRRVRRMDQYVNQ